MNKELFIFLFLFISYYSFSQSQFIDYLQANSTEFQQDQDGSLGKRSEILLNYVKEKASMDMDKLSKETIIQILGNPNRITKRKSKFICHKGSMQFVYYTDTFKVYNFYICFNKMGFVVDNAWIISVRF